MRLTLLTHWPDHIESVNINGIHVNATINGKHIAIRGGRSTGHDWYDEKHQALHTALIAFEKALLDLIVTPRTAPP